MFMRRSGWVIASLWLLLVAVPAGAATPTSFDQVISRISQRETQFAQAMHNYSPMVETYIQDMKPDAELGEVPSGDTYFLGRMEQNRATVSASFVSEHSGFLHRLFGPL